jgi:hypothetical protein
MNTLDLKEQSQSVESLNLECRKYSRIFDWLWLQVAFTRLAKGDFELSDTHFLIL